MTAQRIFSFLVLATLLSCSKTGDYYVDSSGNEGGIINSDTTVKKLFFDAIIIDNVFTASVSYLLNDTAIKGDYKINTISFKLNNLKDENAFDKQLNFISEEIKFSSVKDIAGLSEKINSNNALTFIYSFNKDSINDRDTIDIELNIVTKENGEDKIFTKSFTMYKRNRYKTWFTAH